MTRNIARTSDRVWHIADAVQVCDPIRTRSRGCMPSGSIETYQ